MRKLTVIAALLGSVYFANAQVGIGTPDPALSAELDIVSKTKGILIPRVELTDLAKYAPITGPQQQSLLVYNIKGDNPVASDVVVGFYYWDNAKWNRIVSKAELDETINKIGGDITNITNNVKSIQEVINYILPSNPGNDTEESERPNHTTIVYNSDTKTFQEVTYDGSTYVTKEINISEIIQGFETNTVMVEVTDNGEDTGKVTGYKYFSEKTIKDLIDAGTITSSENITQATVGGITLDVKGDVVNNIKEILESNTTIKVGGETFNTVQEYLQYITQFSEGNVIYKEIEIAGSKKWVFQYWDETKKEYVTIDLQEIVNGLETETQIKRSEVLADSNLPAFTETVTAPVEGNVKKGEIFYAYYNEHESRVDYINMTGDILSSITNNQDIQNAITNVLNQGGNVYFGDHDGNPSTPDVLYSINEKDEKTPIDITSTIIEVINQNIDNIKNILGDKITVDGDTIINTGDTINGEFVFKYMGKTNVGDLLVNIEAPTRSARTSGVKLPTGSNATGLVAITLLDSNKNVVATNVTDVVVTGESVSFNIGTGNHYTTLPQGEYSVIVEFTSSNKPVTPQP